MNYLTIILQAVTTIIVLVLVARFANKRLVSHFEGKPHLAFRRQLIQLGGVLAVILALGYLLTRTPQDTRGQCHGRHHAEDDQELSARLLHHGR